MAGKDHPRRTWTRKFHHWHTNIFDDHLTESCLFPWCCIKPSLWKKRKKQNNNNNNTMYLSSSYHYSGSFGEDRSKTKRQGVSPEPGFVVRFRRREMDFSNNHHDKKEIVLDHPWWDQQLACTQEMVLRWKPSNSVFNISERISKQSMILMLTLVGWCPTWIVG